MPQFPPPANLVVSHYRVIEQIGEGGMGVVYRAHDERLRRDVALKFLSPQSVKDATARDLLLHEARAASALNHPNICTVYDIGQCDGQDYIVMEYVKGHSLAWEIRERGGLGESTIRYGEQIADALTHAHDHGVIHRDLKTSNVIITPEGRAKVLDFGLAKRRTMEGADDQTTNTFEAAETPGAGTMHYTAPEILRGEPADARSDIWALGVVLYEMAAGRRPFHGATAYELSSNILHDPPEALPPKTPLGLRSVVERCLAKSPVERYQQASEVRAVLATLRSNSSLPLSKPTADLVAGSVRGRQRLPWIFLSGILGLVLLLMAGWLFIARHGRRGASTSGPIHSLAVLPLENMSGDPAEEFYAEGMTEELTTQLAQISALRIISRTSVMQYKDTKKSLPEIAKELRVDAIVEGSVMRSGDRVRITAQLIQAATDKHLWAKSYDGDARDVLGLQRNVAQAIANEVRVELTPQEQERLASSQSVSPEAHEAYLKGIYLNNGTPAQQRKAKEYFEEAIRLEPSYAPAYAGLADFYWSTIDLPPRETMPLAKQSVLKALDLDPDLVQAHSELGAIHFYADWDWAAAEKEFRKALELDPNDAESHKLYSQILAALGRSDEASAEIRRAQDLDPLSTPTQITAGFLSYFARQYDHAIDQCRQVLEFDGNSAGAYDCMASSYLAKGMYEEAITGAQKASTLSGNDPQRLVGLGRAYALADRRADAQTVLDQLHRQAAESYVPPYFSAVIYAALGRHDEAFSWLEKAFSERDHYLTWMKVDSAMDPLRRDARFQQLLQRVGLPG